MVESTAQQKPVTSSRASELVNQATVESANMMAQAAASTFNSKPEENKALQEAR